LAEETKDDKDGQKLAANKSADWWLKEIARSGKAWKEYRDKGRKVQERYRNERDKGEKCKRFGILYSNTETLGPAIYSQVPVPDIRRRWADKKDEVGRTAALVLQRATQFCIQSYDFDGVLDGCNKDYLLPGFAVARVKYKPYTKGEGDQAEVVYREASCEYTGWDRFRMSRSKNYEKVWWVAFGDDLTKDEVADIAPDVAEEISYNRKEEGSEEKDEAEPTARVWEVWCKRGRGRFFVAEGYDGWVKAPEPDPLRLEQFFPNAKPIWAISTTDTLIPVPEYLEYEDQALELDDLTERIDQLTSAVRRRGVYDKEYKDLASMLTSAGDNDFVAIENFAKFMASGGLEKMAMEMPLEGVVGAIVALEDRREKVKQIVYEVTGIADIVRGSSNPSETATAQQIKGRWAGLRIARRQKAFANFARDLVRLQSEVIAERFDQQTLSLISGVKLPTQQEKQQYQQQQQAIQMQAQQAAQMAQAQQQPPPPPPQQNPEEAKYFAKPAWEEVIAVLRSDKLRGFKIDIETDSTVQPDADTEKAARNEMLTSVGNFAKSLGMPVPPALASELIQFTVRAYRADSQIEDVMDGLGQQMGPSPQQQQKEKELQDREAKVKQAEDGAKDATHKAQLASKDADMARKTVEVAGEKVNTEKQLFELEKRYEEQVEQLREQFANDVRAIHGAADGIVREAASHAASFAPANDGPKEEAAEKKPRREAPIRDIHIHTGGDKGVEIPKPRGPRWRLHRRL
jgi:hypothetical protein